MSDAIGVEASGGRREPTVSVVMCTYNRSSLAARAIRSCLAQEFADFELVVVDDGSSDDTGEVVETFDDARIRYVRIANRGLSGARNVGLNLAVGTYVAFLDDDDRPDPDWLAELVSALAATSPVACCGMRLESPQGAPMGTQLPRRLGPAFHGATALVRAGTFMSDRRLLIDVGGFETRVGCSHHTELSFRLLTALEERGQTVGVVPRALLTVERRPLTERSRDDPAVKLSATRFMLEQHQEHFARAPGLAATYWSIAGVSAARLGSLREARRCFARSLRLRPSLRSAAHVAATMVAPVGRRVWVGPQSLAEGPGR
jgi:hypothetical protein